jgi:hypothetical protein
MNQKSVIKYHKCERLPTLAKFKICLRTRYTMSSLENMSFSLAQTTGLDMVKV